MSDVFDIPGFPLFQFVRDGIVRCKECGCVWAFNAVGAPHPTNETWSMLSWKSCAKCEPAPLPSRELVFDRPPAFRWNGKATTQEGAMVWFVAPDGSRHGWPQFTEHEAWRLVEFLNAYVARGGGG